MRIFAGVRSLGGASNDSGWQLLQLDNVEDILISWFVIILALPFVCCKIHCKHLRLSDANKLTHVLTYLLTYPGMHLRYVAL